MNTHSVLALTFAVCLASQAGLAPASGRETLRSPADLAKLQSQVQSVAEKVTPATVALLSMASPSSGSGVVTSADGLILTAAHVVQGNREMMVVFPDGKQVRGKVLGANFSRDIAMVRILDKGPWPFNDRGTSKDLKAGDWVVALGHSGGFDPDRPPPVRFGRVISTGPGLFLTTDCTLIGGDSGGPVFDLDGKIVGVNSNIGTSLQNNNHSGVDGFAADWDRLLAGDEWGRLTLNPLNSPDMPALGIVLTEYPVQGGVEVVGFLPRSPASAAGVRPGDVISAVDSSPVESNHGLRQLLAKRQTGETVKLTIRRDDETREVPVKLGRFSYYYR